MATPAYVPLPAPWHPDELEDERTAPIRLAPVFDAEPEADVDAWSGPSRSPAATPQQMLPLKRRRETESRQSPESLGPADTDAEAEAAAKAQAAAEHEDGSEHHAPPAPKRPRALGREDDVEAVPLVRARALPAAAGDAHEERDTRGGSAGTPSALGAATCGSALAPSALALSAGSRSALALSAGSRSALALSAGSRRSAGSQSARPLQSGVDGSRQAAPPRSAQQLDAARTDCVRRTERPNMAVLRYLTGPQSAMAGVTDEEQRVLKPYRDAARHGKVTVDYKFGRATRGEGCAGSEGRWYAQGPSCQAMPKRVRSALMKDGYIDVDVANAQPTLLAQWCTLRGWPCPELQRYVADRDAWLAAIVDAGCAPDRAGAKQALVSVMFGKQDVQLPAALAAYVPEMGRISDRVLAHARRALPGLVAAVEAAHRSPAGVTPASATGQRPPSPAVPRPVVPNLRGKVLAMVMQTEERRVLEAMERGLGAAGYVMETYIHDGGLVRKRAAGETELPEAVLRDVEAAVRADTGYAIRLVCKPMETDLELPASTEEGEAAYAKMKAEFEVRHFKVVQLAVFGLEAAGSEAGAGSEGGEEEEEVRTLTEAQLKTAYRHLRLPDGKAFIDRWLVDPGIRRYETMTCRPPGAPGGARSPCPPSVYNTWPGFAAERLPPVPQGTPAAAAAEAGVERIRWHLRHIVCGGDDACNTYLLGWMAHMLRSPGDKGQVPAVILSGPQGAGKDTVVALLSALLGPRLVAHSRHPQQVFGERNSLVAGKLLVGLEEGGLGAGGREAEALIEAAKSAITSPTVTVRFLYRDPRPQPSFERYVWTTNLVDPVRVEPSCRRFFILSVRGDKRGDKAYFDALHAAIANAGTQRVLFDWLRSDDSLLEGWVAQDYPRTALQREIAAACTPPAVQFALHFLAQQAGEIRVSSSDLFRAFRTWATDHGHAAAASMSCSTVILRLKMQAHMGEAATTPDRKSVHTAAGNVWALDAGTWRDVLRAHGFEAEGGAGGTDVEAAAAAAVAQDDDPCTWAALPGMRTGAEAGAGAGAGAAVMARPA